MIKQKFEDPAKLSSLYLRISICSLIVYFFQASLSTWSTFVQTLGKPWYRTGNFKKLADETRSWSKSFKCSRYKICLVLLFNSFYAFKYVDKNKQS